MAESGTSYESRFLEWLSTQVTSAQLSAIYVVFADINSFCLSRRILAKPLFETDDLTILSKVRTTVESNKVFAVHYKKQKNAMIAAIRHYCRFIKEIKDSDNPTEPQIANPEDGGQDKQTIASLSDLLKAESISYIDNRLKNGCLWIIGGEELKAFVDRCSTYGVTFHFKADGTRATDFEPAWWTTDDINRSPKEKSSAPKEEASSARKLSAATTSDKPNREKFAKWLGTHGIPSESILSVLSALQRCSDRVKRTKIIVDDIYSVTSADTMDAIRRSLLADTDFIRANQRTENRFKNALDLYTEYFEQLQFPADAVNDEAETVLAPSVAAPSEIDELLSEQEFLPLKHALALENIRTIKELKELKLWTFMNQNNLYSIPVRQAVLLKVRQLLESPTKGDQEHLYKLHCGSNVFLGDTPARAFLHFCEAVASKYPLFFRSILDKKIGSAPDAEICRMPGKHDCIKMENPTCFINAHLTADAVLTAAERICQQYGDKNVLVLLEAPATTTVVSAPSEEQKVAPSSAGGRAKKEQPSTDDMGELQLDLDNRSPLAFTKPTCLSYKGQKISCSSWGQLYLQLVRKLYGDYPTLFKPGMHFGESHRIDFGSGDRMVNPKLMEDGIYLECNVSATGIVSKIRWLLNLCSIDPGDVVINYQNRGSTSYRKGTQAKQKPIKKAVTNALKTAEKSGVCPAYTEKSAVAGESKQIQNAEKLVLATDMSGLTYDDLAKGLRIGMAATKSLVQQCKRIVEIKMRLYHEDAFVDWDDGARRMCTIMEKLMQKNSGYISAAQLYDYVRVEMNMFLNDNDVNDERAVYEIAQHLFEKNQFGGNHYVFNGKAHISRTEDAISSNFEVICKFAEEQGGVFLEEDLVEYLTKMGIKAGNLRLQMHLNKEPDFFFYEPRVIISAKSMGIDDAWKAHMAHALENLLNDADGHVVLREIQPIWFESLPPLPSHRRWTPLLLQSVLRCFGKELGTTTIAAMESQNMDTLHAMLVAYDGPIQNFGDAVVSYLVENEIEQRSFEAEDLRQLLVKSGMVQGNELILNMSKALAKDERFAWDVKGENVTVRV